MEHTKRRPAKLQLDVLGNYQILHFHYLRLQCESNEGHFAVGKCISLNMASFFDKPKSQVASQ